ncbi:MAG: ABC transporter ATP-binding protein/permease [Erysipelotrichaceae bacterium]|nr:ABC transporter ATP-binding protein/permease [Erysipelotrichaceae bacterium]
MLKIRNISKTYKTGDLVQQALDDVSLDLRDNEFVAILGPSGSGKTTLLNIIGGLDRYDEGDLIINGVSTKNYKDRDWDTYRNHTIGFVFQSYNLIPHQSVLSNVELALTIGGISRKERRQRALNALAEVGLKEHAHKRPNQMSGGQMQRVAIARALVNNPDILLADEPTGALDSKTSIQVMELLKEVARDRLVVMVTHNPDLAQQYANRIVNLKDGHIISDSNPFVDESNEIDEKPKKVKKAHMSYLTALSLSFNNLLTKKGRTILTAFAGSIGIIGIALITSLSTGFQNYIDKIQEDTLSSYPLTITSETADATSAILTMVSDRENYKSEGNYVRERQYLTTMFSVIGSNDLKSLKAYLDAHPEEYRDDVTHINYAYSIRPTIYTIDAADNLAKLNPSSLMSTMYSSQATSFMSTLSMGGNSVFSEMNENTASYKDQYDVLAGRWPERYDELLLVLSEPNSISDLLVYSLGLRDTNELRTIITNVMSGEESGIRNEPREYSYEDLMNIDLKLIEPTDVYRYNVKYDVYEDMSNDDVYMRDLYDRSLSLKIVGIVCLKEGDNSMALNPGICYRKDLCQYIIAESARTAIVSKQLADRDIDVFSGKRFDEVNEEGEQKLDFNEMVSIDEEMLKDAFKIDIDQDAFKFETVDENAMRDIVMDSAETAAEMIANTPDKTLLTGIFTLVNSSFLQQQVNAYDEAHLKVEEVTPEPADPEQEAQTKTLLLLDAEEIQKAAAAIDGSAYKQFAKILVANSQQYIAELGGNDVTPLLDMITSQQYDSLAQGVQSMFTSYYESLSQIAEEGTVVYQKEENDTVYSGAEGIELRSSQLLPMQLGNETALTNTSAVISQMINDFTVMMIAGQIGAATAKMMEPMTDTFSKLGDMFSGDIVKFDTDKFAKAFNFNMDQDELSRLMETMMQGTDEKSANSNLIALGYQDLEDPTSISFYFKDFESKENFLSFLERYNESVDEDTRVRYTDITGILMSSVKTIVDVVTYVLIAFVSISLVVSSIMIAVITLISVLERTKEIGILRAMGASKRNVSSIFSAETFIIGALSGLLGVGVTLASLPLINRIIHNVADNNDVNAVLPKEAAIALVLISIFLTIIAGFIPSKKAAKQDPVIALRTE